MLLKNSLGSLRNSLVLPDGSPSLNWGTLTSGVSTQQPMSPWKTLMRFPPLEDSDVVFLQLKTCSWVQYPTAVQREQRAESNVLSGRGCCSTMGQRPGRLLFLGRDYYSCCVSCCSSTPSPIRSETHNIHMPLFFLIQLTHFPE